MARHPNIFKSYLYAFILCFVISGLTACLYDDDDENMISVCNYDDEEYLVQLHRYNDDVVVGEFQLGEWYDLNDVCDEFEDLPEGRYYLTIYEEYSTVAADSSEDFYLDSDECEYFRIESPGKIKRR